MKHVTLLKKISDKKIPYADIQVYGGVEVMAPGLDQCELNFDGMPIDQVIKELNECGLFGEQVFWKWAGTQSADESMILVATPKGDADFIDFARFIDWVRVLAELDEDADCDDIEQD